MVALIVPFPAMAVAFGAVIGSLGGVREMPRAFVEGGPATYGVLFWAVLGVLALGVLLFFKAKGVRIPAAVVGLVAVLPWLTGLAGMQWGLARTAEALANVNPADQQIIFAAGASESNAAALLGYAFAAALLAACGIGLGCASVARPSAGPRPTGAVVGLALALPCLVFALKAALVAGIAGILLVTPAAVALAVAAALAGAGAFASAETDAPISAGVAAVAFGGLAVAAGLGAAWAHATHELGSAIARVDPEMRVVLVGHGASIAVPFANSRMIANALLVVPVLGVLAIGLRSSGFSRQVAGIAGTLVLVGLCAFQAVRAEASVSTLAIQFSRPPWAAIPDFQPIRRCEAGRTAPQAFLSSSALQFTSGKVVSLTAAGELAEAIKREENWGESSSGSHGRPSWTLAVDRRVLGNTLLDVLKDAASAGAKSFALAGLTADASPELQRAADAAPLIRLFTGAPGTSGVVLFASALRDQPADEKRWQGRLGEEGPLLLEPVAGAGTGALTVDLQGAESVDRDLPEPKGQVLLDLSAAVPPERLALATSRLAARGYQVVGLLAPGERPTPPPELPAPPPTTGLGGLGMSGSQPVVMGSLDKEVISRVVKRNLNQVRYCYESQLVKNPKLAGKVDVKFVIAANGSVASATVGSSTVADPALETCLQGRVRTWLFPHPRGGGIVIVTYPFVFKPAD